MIFDICVFTRFVRPLLFFVYADTWNMRILPILKSCAHSITTRSVLCKDGKVINIFVFKYSLIVLKSNNLIELLIRKIFSRFKKLIHLLIKTTKLLACLGVFGSIKLSGCPVNVTHQQIFIHSVLNNICAEKCENLIVIENSSSVKSYID